MSASALQLVPRPQISDDDVQRALVSLIEQLAGEQKYEHRLAVMRASKARQFWKGIQYGHFNPQGQWVNPTAGMVGEQKPEDAPRFEFVENVYQATGLIIIAALASAGVPGTRFLPQDPRDPGDVAYARQGGAILDYIESCNPDAFWDWIEIAKLLYTDGLVVGYARHLRDAERYGTTRKPDVQMKPTVVQEAGYPCLECGSVTPFGKALQGACAECGGAIDIQRPLGPQTMDLPEQVGVKETPNGREVADYFGVLETRVPHWAKKIEQCPYLGIEIDVHAASLRAAFPEMAEKIQAGYGGEYTYARTARQQVMSPAAEGKQGTSATELVTYRRWWLRPEAFWVLDQEIRDELLARFPKGVRCELAGDLYLTSAPEAMQDHVRLCRGIPGDGMFTPALGESFIEEQEMHNEAVNLNFEAMETSAFAPILYDSGALDQGAVSQRLRPGEWKPVPVRQGKALRESVWQPEVKEQSRAAEAQKERSMAMAQYLTGAQPALFGASQENVSTLGGQQLMRNQAMQRQGIPYQAAKSFKSQMDLLLVQEFARNRTDDVFYAVAGKGPQDFEVRQVATADTEGRLLAKPETTESAPRSSEQKRQAWQALLASGNPAIQQWTTLPENLQFAAEIFGQPDLFIPGQAARQKILRTIRRLTEEQSGPEGPSQQPEPFVDDPALVVEVVRAWAVSDAGQQVREQNPAGYANVIAYGMAAQAQMQPPAPAPEQGQGFGAPSSPGPGEGSPAAISPG